MGSQTSDAGLMSAIYDMEILQEQRNPLTEKAEIAEADASISAKFGDILRILQHTPSTDLGFLDRLLQLLINLSKSPDLLYRDRGETYDKFAESVLKLLQASKSRMLDSKDTAKAYGGLHFLRILHELVKSEKDCAAVEAIILTTVNYLSWFSMDIWNAGDALEILEVGLKIGSSIPGYLREPTRTLISDVLSSFNDTEKIIEVAARVRRLTMYEYCYDAQWRKDAMDEIVTRTLSLVRNLQEDAEEVSFKYLGFELLLTRINQCCPDSKGAMSADTKRNMMRKYIAETMDKNKEREAV